MPCLLVGGLSLSFLGLCDVIPIGFGILVVISEPLRLPRGEHLVNTSSIFCRGETLVCAIRILEFDAFNHRGSGCNKDLLCSQGLLHHCHEVRGTHVEIDTVGVVRFAYLNNSLEGDFFYSSKEVTHVGASINSSITIALEALHLLEDCLVASNIHVEFVRLKFPT